MEELTANVQQTAPVVMDIQRTLIHAREVGINAEIEPNYASRIFLFV